MQRFQIVAPIHNWRYRACTLYVGGVLYHCNSNGQWTIKTKSMRVIVEYGEVEEITYVMTSQKCQTSLTTHCSRYIP